MKNNKLLFLTSTHGDEGFTVPVLKKLSKQFVFDWKIANYKAYVKNTRFIEADLNRSGPGNPNSKIYEEKRASEIIALGKQYQTVIDLHGTIGATGIFVIITNPNWENIELAKKFNIKNVVLWPGLKPTGPLTQFIPNSLEIECGPKNLLETSQKLEEILEGYLSKKDREIKQKFFIVNGIFTKETTDKMEEFTKFTYKNDSFYPLMIGQYPKIKCYMMQKLSDKL
jgi:hypothetical protein